MKNDMSDAVNVREGDTMTKEKMNVDQLLRVVGAFGRFQWMLDAMFCVMIIPSTYQILIMYFAALKPGWRCVFNSTVCQYNGTLASDFNARCDMPRSEWEFVEPPEFSIVTQFDIYCDKEWMIHVTTSILFIGWAFGAVVLGWMADNYGRKLVLFPSLIVCMGAGLLCSFMPNVPALLVCRFIVGFATPGTSVQMFILISEYVDSKHRPLAGIILWLFFTLSLCLLGLKAYFIRRWGMLFIVCTAPYICIMLFYKFVPESVRWLRLQGRIEDAMTIFHRIAGWNQRHLSESIALQQVFEHSEGHKSTPRDLFKSRRMAISTLIQGFAWLANGMVYYGLSLAADDLGGNLYRNYVLVSIVEFPAIVFAIDFCERFGRKKTVSLSLLSAGVACIIVAFVPTTSAKAARIVLGMLGKLFVTVSFDAIYTWSVELYPTDIRAEGMGFLQITSRIGAASSPWIAKALKNLHAAAPFVVMGTVAIISSLLTMFLPETKGLQSADTQDEVKSVLLTEKETSK